MNKKTIALILIVGLFVIGGVVAELVSYYGSNKEEEFTVAESTGIAMDNDTWTLPTKAGENTMFALGFTNNLAMNVTTNVTLTLQEKNGTEWINVTDDAGWYIAYTDVLSCCLDGYCKQADDMTGITDCKAQYQQWMTQNPTWIYWGTTQPVTDQNMTSIEYTHTLVNNKSAVHVPMVNGEAKFLVEMHPGKFLSVVYVGTDARLKGGTYKLVANVDGA